MSLGARVFFHWAHRCANFLCVCRFWISLCVSRYYRDRWRGYNHWDEPQPHTRRRGETYTGWRKRVARRSGSVREVSIQWRRLNLEFDIKPLCFSSGLAYLVRTHRELSHLNVSIVYLLGLIPILSSSLSGWWFLYSPHFYFKDIYSIEPDHIFLWFAIFSRSTPCLE